MNLKKLGETNYTVSALGLGMAALGRPGYITLGHADDLNNHYDLEVMESHAHRVLDAAYEAGVHGLHPNLIKLLGQLHFRSSLGQI